MVKREATVSIATTNVKRIPKSSRRIPGHKEPTWPQPETENRKNTNLTTADWRLSASEDSEVSSNCFLSSGNDTLGQEPIRFAICPYPKSTAMYMHCLDICTMVPTKQARDPSRGVNNFRISFIPRRSILKNVGYKSTISPKAVMRVFPFG